MKTTKAPRKPDVFKYEGYEIRDFVKGGVHTYELWGKYLYGYTQDGWKFWKVKPRYGHQLCILHLIGSFNGLSEAENFMTEHTGGYYNGGHYYDKQGKRLGWI